MQFFSYGRLSSLINSAVSSLSDGCDSCGKYSCCESVPKQIATGYLSFEKQRRPFNGLRAHLYYSFSKDSGFFVLACTAYEKKCGPNYARRNLELAKDFLKTNAGVLRTEACTNRDGQVVATAETSFATKEDAVRLFTTPRFAFLLGIVVALLGAISLTGIVFGKFWQQIRERSKAEKLSTKDSYREALRPYEAPSAFSFFLKRDVRRKETVEWVNMVLGKLWKVYRRGLETWLVNLLQPLIDNLQKPNYVRRVKIKQFYLGDEPLSVRSVERRTSRRANDLQYHIGLRYTGEARVLVLITLRAGILPLVIPVKVRGLDLDGELWVKLRLIPSQPWVGSVTWAFVTLPKITLALAPFGLFNIMALPFISRFLTKLLTEDLPRLFVRPNKIVTNFLNNKPSDKDFKDKMNGNEDFSGELSVTIVDARKLSYFALGKTDPYIVLNLGDQVVRSKKNSQTSIIGPPGAPIWNQDFQLLVVDPNTEKLSVCARDRVGLTVFDVGYGEVELSKLQDTVPTDKVVTLRRGWGPFPKRFVGEIMLRLTYKAYVDDDDDDDEDDDDEHDDVNDVSDVSMRRKKLYRKKKRQSYFLNNLITAVNAAVDNMGVENVSFSAKERDDVSVGADVANGMAGNDADVSSSADVASDVAGENADVTKNSPTDKQNSAVVWLGLAAGIALLVSVSLNFSNLLNP